MCGINGLFSRTNSFDLASTGSRMNALIQHRGPDDEGSVVFGKTEGFPLGTPKSVSKDHTINYLDFKNDVQPADKLGWFGHQRLSIIDLSSLGHEPMTDETGNYWLTYNGEVYNYLEIKNELELLGVSFRSNTDAEVVLKAYIQWGEACLHKFNGMWAFAVYNVEKQQLFASRDRFGVKPFYYWHTKEQFAFSSEQKALVMSGIVPKKIHKKAVFDYLAFASIESEKQGFFEGVIELEPGFNLKFDYKNWTFKTEQYYDLIFAKKSSKINANTESEYIDHISGLFSNAVNLRLRSDVEVGACLSGGIDSSAIVTQMSALGQERVHTFTASTPQKEFDESHYAQVVNGEVDARAYSIVPTSSDFLSDLDELVYSQDIPIFSTSTYAQFRVMKKVKESGVKVVLDGQGGDELFGGYLPYHINQWLDDLKKGDISGFMRETKAFETLPTGIKFFVKQYLKNYGIKGLPSVLYKKIIQYYQTEHQYIAPELMNEFGTAGYRKSKQKTPKSLNGILKHEFYNSRLKGYLKCEDRCSMWHGVEARTPFADDINMIEYVFNIPGNYKIQKGVKKYLLKEATEHILPQEIYNRKDKMGYVTPNNQWVYEIKDELRKYFTPDLEEYFNYDLLMKNYDSFFNQIHIPENQRMFKFIAFAVWKKVYGL